MESLANLIIYIAACFVDFIILFLRSRTKITVNTHDVKDRFKFEKELKTRVAKHYDERMFILARTLNEAIKQKWLQNISQASLERKERIAKKNFRFKVLNTIVAHRNEMETIKNLKKFKDILPDLVQFATMKTNVRSVHYLVLANLKQFIQDRTKHHHHIHQSVIPCLHHAVRHYQWRQVQKSIFQQDVLLRAIDIAHRKLYASQFILHVSKFEKVLFQISNPPKKIYKSSKSNDDIVYILFMAFIIFWLGLAMLVGMAVSFCIDLVSLCYDQGVETFQQYENMPKKSKNANKKRNFKDHRRLVKNTKALRRRGYFKKNKFRIQQMQN
jgi:hypothetical protein